MSRGLKSVVVIACVGVPCVFVLAFIVLRHLRATGQDPAFASDGAIVSYIVWSVLLVLIVPAVHLLRRRMERRMSAFRTTK